MRVWEGTTLCTGALAVGIAMVLSCCAGGTESPPEGTDPPGVEPSAPEPGSAPDPVRPEIPPIPPEFEPCDLGDPDPTRTRARIAGRVTDESGRPIAGALIRLGEPELASVLTDPSGCFNLGTDKEPRRDLVVIAEASGFHSVRVTPWAWLLDDRPVDQVQWHFRLWLDLEIQAGENVDAFIGPQASVLCGLEDEWICRRVQIHVARSGTLQIAIEPAWLDFFVNQSFSYPPNRCCTGSTEVPVDAGNINVYVAKTWQVRDETPFRLTTTLTP